MSNDDLHLRQAMRDYAAALSSTHTPPPTARVWLRAQRHRKQADLKRAEQPMRIMQAVAVVCTLILATWLALDSGTLTAWTAAKTPYVVLAIATAAASVAVGYAMIATNRKHTA